jgi:hypothetical protein
MLRKRHQYRMLQAAFVFALIGIAFFGAYQGGRPWQLVETHGVADHGDKKHPPFFSWEYFTGDPVACATFGLAVFTGLLFLATVRLAREGRDAAEASLRAALQNTETLIKTERPYLTGGGGFKVQFFEIRSDPSADYVEGVEEKAVGRKVFLVDVKNNGKTPALLTHYDVQFATFEEVKAGPREIYKKYEHHDWLASGEGKSGIRAQIIPSGNNVVFGGFWYLDFQKDEHCFRFILSIEEDTTRPNIADEVDPSYTDWT